MLGRSRNYKGPVVGNERTSSWNGVRSESAVHIGCALEFGSEVSVEIDLQIAFGVGARVSYTNALARSLTTAIQKNLTNIIGAERLCESLKRCRGCNWW